MTTTDHRWDEFLSTMETHLADQRRRGVQFEPGSPAAADHGSAATADAATDAQEAPAADTTPPAEATPAASSAQPSAEESSQ